MSKDFPKVSSYPRLLVAGFIFLFATCSFYGNSFSAADPSWFTQHQLDSEQLVLDGILHSRHSNHGKPIVLGRYTRPEIPDQYTHAHRLFGENNQDGQFNSYGSQYGLQVKVFTYLFSKGFSISAIQLLVASCMALCLSCSIGMHASQLETLGKPGLETIWDTAATRGSSTTPGSIVERACKNFTDPEKLKGCQDQYISSLTLSPFKVVFRYLFVPSFLPWTGHNIGRYSSQFIFPIFVALIFFSYRRDFLAALTIGSFFIGSTSWFVAAKGHFYIHYSMNYVLWYLLFIPVAVLLVGERLSRRHDAES